MQFEAQLPGTYKGTAHHSRELGRVAPSSSLLDHFLQTALPCKSSVEDYPAVFSSFAETFFQHLQNRLCENTPNPKSSRHSLPPVTMVDQRSPRSQTSSRPCQREKRVMSAQRQTPNSITLGFVTNVSVRCSSKNRVFTFPNPAGEPNLSPISFEDLSWSAPTNEADVKNGIDQRIRFEFVLDSYRRFEKNKGWEAWQFGNPPSLSEISLLRQNGEWKVASAPTSAYSLR